MLPDAPEAREVRSSPLHPRHLSSVLLALVPELAYLSWATPRTPPFQVDLEARSRVAHLLQQMVLPVAAVIVSLSGVSLSALQPQSLEWLVQLAEQEGHLVQQVQQAQHTQQVHKTQQVS